MDRFWKTKNVLVTGASGFVGGHLTIRLLRCGASVTVLNHHRISPPSLLADPPVRSKITEAITGDISNSRFIHRLFKTRRFDFCFHLAAQPLVDVANSDPTPSFDVNIKGTWNILEATRQNPLDGLLLLSTSHVYGDNQTPFLEEYFPRPSRPYETSKACADMLAQTYANYYSLPIAIARCVNLYGPGDQNARLIPKTIRLLLQNKRPEVYRDDAVRDYMYIDDAVSAFMILTQKVKALRNKNRNIIYNFGTGKHYSVSHIVQKIIAIFDQPAIKPIMGGKRRQEIGEQYVSISKAMRRLGWHPQYSLREGLLATIHWYQSQRQFAHHLQGRRGADPHLIPCAF